jgi:hypothetical protein
MKSSCGHGDAQEPEKALGGAEEVAYFRAKAKYLRHVASTAAPGFMRPTAIINLLERLAGEFEERAFEVERELRARLARKN